MGISSWVTGEKRFSRASVHGQRCRAWPGLEQEALGTRLWAALPAQRPLVGAPGLEVAPSRAAFVTLRGLSGFEAV